MDTTRGHADRRRTAAWIGFLAALTVAACDRQPHAPPLVQGLAVYHDAREGFRFEPPPGWFQQVRAHPPGRRGMEDLLVKYRSLASGDPGQFRVTMMDMPDPAGVPDYLAGRPPGEEEWRIDSRREETQVGGRRATRVTYRGTWEEDEGRKPVIKEVVAVPKGSRVYFFTGIFAAGDKAALETVRKAVASVAWDPTR
jgi:hypothetical protein